jgi:hypothetical protein
MRDDPTAAVAALLEQPDTQLFIELAKRDEAIKHDPTLGELFTPVLPADAFESLGARDTLEAFGREFFNRFSNTAYGLVCGSETKNETERQKIVAALKIGPEAMAASMAVFFVTTFAWPAAIASVIATLCVKLFFQPGHTAMCAVWKKKLPAESSEQADTPKVSEGAAGASEPRADQSDVSP